jgi:hypothetical protein
MRETDDDFVTKVDTAIEMKDRAEAAWQPIETAPKDGTLIMIWWLPLRYDGSLLHPEKELAAGHIMDGIRYDADLQTWMRGGTYADYRNNIKPTHWMPLPAPPSNPSPAPTPSPEAVAKFALGHAVRLCCPHEDDDDTAHKARQECADAIAFASIVPDTIAAIIKTAGEKKDE